MDVSLHASGNKFRTIPYTKVGWLGGWLTAIGLTRLRGMNNLNARPLEHLEKHVEQMPSCQPMFAFLTSVTKFVQQFYCVRSNRVASHYVSECILFGFKI